MSQPTLESFFSGGGKSFSWKDKPIGTTISGTIKAVHAPTQQTDPKDGSPVFRKDGSPKMSVRIDLATNERDPQDPDDDGSRALYVQGWMTGAIGNALRKAGRQGPPEVGAQLTVTLTEREAPANAALSPTNKFSATYVSPAVQATDQFFNQPPNGQPPAPPGYQQGPPPQFAQQPVQQAPPQQYTQAPVQQAFAAASPAPPEPQRPAAISEAAWAAMDASTKAAVAATMSQVPNF